MDTGHAGGELFAALSKVQGKLKTVIKTSDNPFFNSKYAKLADFWDACRELLAENGLSVISSPASVEPIVIEGVDKDGPYKENGVRVTLATILGHKSGQYVQEYSQTCVQGMGPQQVGSAVEYLRRYVLSSMVGMASDDDDGEAAHGRSAPQKSAPPQSKPIAVPNGSAEKFKRVTAEVNRLKWPAEQVKSYLLNNFKKDKIGLLTIAECDAAYNFLKDIKPTETKKED